MKSRLSTKKIVLIASVAALAVSSYFLVFDSLTITENAELKAMKQLEETKFKTAIQPFETDGCSGNVSANWTTTITAISQISPTFAESYADAETIPFESACIEHDKKYHQGEGGYDARLAADEELKADIIAYAKQNTTEIADRTGVESEEIIMSVYEAIAESVYFGVRLGGAPCTGEEYAWGYGYNNGSCVDEW